MISLSSLKRMFSSPSKYETLKKNIKNKKEDKLLKQFLNKNKNDTIWDTVIKLVIKLSELETQTINNKKLLFNVIEDKKDEIERAFSSKLSSSLSYFKTDLITKTNTNMEFKATHLLKDIENERMLLAKLFKRSAECSKIFELPDRVNKMATILNEVTRILKKNGLVENNTNTPQKDN